MRFKPGQEVVCINDSGWYDMASKAGWKGPKKDEIVHVKGYHQIVSHIFLEEYQNLAPNGKPWAYLESCFEPVMQIGELQAIAQGVGVPAGIVSGCHTGINH